MASDGVHGDARYRQGCRCPACIDAHASRLREYRKRRARDLAQARRLPTLEIGIRRVWRVARESLFASLPGEGLFPLRAEDLTVEPWGSAGHPTKRGVRITHKPTGVSGESDYHRSQLKNREEALVLLRHRLEQLP